MSSSAATAMRSVAWTSSGESVGSPDGMETCGFDSASAASGAVSLSLDASWTRRAAGERELQANAVCSVTCAYMAGALLEGLGAHRRLELVVGR